MSHTGPGMFQFGGQGPPLEGVAESTLARMRGQLQPGGPVPRPLTEQEQQEAAQATHCALCGGIHAAPSSPACPRLATFELDGDGKVVKGTFWPGTDWAEGRVVLAEDATEEGSDD